MTEAGLSTAIARDLRDKVAEGDLTWVRQHFLTGELNFLKDRLTTLERAQFAGRVGDGDMPWIREVLSRVDIPGVGFLSPSQPGAVAADQTLVIPPPPPASIVPPPPLAPTMLEAPDHAPIMPPPPRFDRPSGPAMPGPLGSATSAIGSAPSAAIGAVTGAASGSADRAASALGGAAGAVSSASGSAITGAVSTSTEVVTKVRKKRRLGPIFLLIGALLALLWWVKGRNTDDKITAATSVVTVAAKPSSSAAPTTAAGGPTTLAGAVTTAAPGGAQSVTQVVAADKNLSVLNRAIGAAGLGDTLSNGGPYTMFAPTNDAFAQLPAGALDKLLGNKDALTKVLLYHVAQGNLTGPGAKAGPVPSLTGQPLALTVEGTNVMVNGVAATPGTGTVYTVGKVLLPPGFSLDSLTAPAVTTVAPAATTAKPTATTAAPAPATTAAPAPATTAAPAATTVPPTAAPAPPTPAGGISVFFNAGSSDLTGEAMSQLKVYASKIKAAGGKPVVNVVGYADERGTPASIALVAGERAQRVINYLSGTLGVNATFKSTNGGAIAGKDYDKARRVDISI